MGTDILGPDYRVTIALLSCVVRDGIENVSVDVVAGEMWRSRAGLYAQFGGWRGMVRHAHSQTVGLFDGMSTSG